MANVLTCDKDKLLWARIAAGAAGKATASGSYGLGYAVERLGAGPAASNLRAFKCFLTPGERS